MRRRGRRPELRATDPRQRPVAHLALRDPAHRSDIARALRERGWTVVEAPTGYHLIESIAGAILGDQPWPRLDLIAADAVSPGCSGATIADGLRELGWFVPIVLVARPGERLPPDDPDRLLFTVSDPELALPVIAAVARGYQLSDRSAGFGGACTASI